MSEKFAPLLNKEMTRKEFMVTLGLLIVSFLGFSTIVGILTGKLHHHSNYGFGSGPYGMSKD